jgi:adenylate cyclase
MTEVVAFGPYRFEPKSARLWSGEREIRLTPKAAAVLTALLRRAGQPVTKQELFATVWGNTIVSDDALVTCIQELRRVLRDSARVPSYIETRRRSGYRFVAAVTEQTTQTAPAAAAPAASTIAVLPFMDMSPGRDQDYFCEGLAEELIDALGKIDGLRVAARSLSFRFRGASLDLREVGTGLGVAAIVEGSVRKAGDRLRITVQLVDVASGYQRWSQRFEREIGDVFAIQDEIAESVAATVRGGELSTRERHALRRPKTSVEPYEYFLRGRQGLHRESRPDIEQSRGMFERAVELDGTYAPAWAGLATVHAVLYEWWGSRPDDLERADHASQTAMELAPELADAHVARGLALSLHRRYDEAAVHFEAAIRINANLYDAYYYYARMAFARGDIERSVELFGAAAKVRPEDCVSQLLLAQSLFMLGRDADAHEANRAGIARAERILKLNPLDGRVLSLGAGSLQTDGQIDRAFEWSQRALDLYPDDMSALINAACLAATTGRKDDALRYLDRALEGGRGNRDWLERDSDFDSLRDDPRFQALLGKLK